MNSKRYIRTITRHFVVWFFAFIFWALLREFGNDIVRPDGPQEFDLVQRLRFHVALAVIAGLIFGSIEFFVEKYVYKRTSFGRAIIIGAIAYLAAIVLLVTFGFGIFIRISGNELDVTEYGNYIFSEEMLLLIFYCFLVGTLIDVFKEIDKKFGPGNLWKMLKGEFYHPKEERRIFMFLDLKNSTGIAEKLGHEAYSLLIQRCFYDVSDLVPKYKASIYQYVGDEIVLSWTVKAGLGNLNCIKFFFAYHSKLESEVESYMADFGLLPEFKAGIEMGPVMVAEVGEIKREIAYHGDVLNTAARIQSCCNKYQKQLLISENLVKSITNNVNFQIELLGDLQLKGKEKTTNVYSVELI